MKRVTSHEAWLEQALAKHKKRFNYSKSKYVHSKTKLKIICPDHGEFQTLPSAHIKKESGGCSKCGYVLSKNSRKMTTKQFIRKSKLVHGNKYDYSHTVYEHSRVKLEIFCNKCDKYFQQIAFNHMSGHGCSCCAKGGE